MCFSPLRFTRRVTHGVSNHKLSLKCFFILIVFKELVPHETKIARENMVNFLFQQNLFSPFGSRSHSSPTSGKFYPDCSIGQDPVLDFQNKMGWGKLKCSRGGPPMASDLTVTPEPVSHTFCDRKESIMVSYSRFAG